MAFELGMDTCMNCMGSVVARGALARCHRLHRFARFAPPPRPLPLFHGGYCRYSQAFRIRYDLLIDAHKLPRQEGVAGAITPVNGTGLSKTATRRQSTGERFCRRNPVITMLKSRGNDCRHPSKDPRAVTRSRRKIRALAPMRDTPPVPPFQRDTPFRGRIA